MKQEEYVSTRKLSGVRGGGEAVDITVAIGIPYRDEKIDSWACPVEAEGLFKKLADQHGIDSWQAFRLCQKLVVSLLHDFLDKGGKLYIFGEVKEMTKEEIEEFF